MSKLSPADDRYNREITLLDGFFEFHPEWFLELSADERSVLESYYLLGKPVLDNVFEHRRAITRADPTLPTRARTTLRRVLKHVRVEL